MKPKLRKGNHTTRKVSGNKPYARYFLTVLSYALFALPSYSSAQERISAEEIKNNIEYTCSAVFMPETQVEIGDCNDCRKEIENFVIEEDQKALETELEEKGCRIVFDYVPEPEETGWSIYFDNDLLALDSWTGLNDDRNYTMGLGGSFGGKKYSSGYLSEPRSWIDRIIGLHNHNNSRNGRKHHSFDFGVTAFTPNVLEQRAPIVGDRPYASLLYFTNSKISAFNNNSAVKSTFTVGVLGLDIAKGFQRFLHNDLKVSNQDPLGWDNQISEGGELTFLYTYKKIKLLYPAIDTDGTTSTDFSFSYDVNAGYYTNISTGFDFRFGKRISTPYYMHQSNPLGNYSQLQTEAGNSNAEDNYFFLSYRARLVGYNALLQGQFRHSEVTFSDSEIKRLIHEASIGYAYSIKSDLHLTFSLNYHSNEFKSAFSREHWFGGLYLTKAFGKN